MWNNGLWFLALSLFFLTQESIIAESHFRNTSVEFFIFWGFIWNSGWSPFHLQNFSFLLVKSLECLEVKSNFPIRLWPDRVSWDANWILYEFKCQEKNLFSSCRWKKRRNGPPKIKEIRKSLPSQGKILHLKNNSFYLKNVTQVMTFLPLAIIKFFPSSSKLKHFLL